MITMAYVLTQSEMFLASTSRDFRLFEGGARQRHLRTIEARELLADCDREHRWTDEGPREPFTVFYHPGKRVVIDVVPGHI